MVTVAGTGSLRAVVPVMACVWAGTSIFNVLYPGLGSFRDPMRSSVGLLTVNAPTTSPFKPPVIAVLDDPGAAPVIFTEPVTAGTLVALADSWCQCPACENSAEWMCPASITAWLFAAIDDAC